MVLAACAAALVAAAAPAPAHAQFFALGQNKIQYRSFDWRVLHGPHVDLYYYPSEARLARSALAYAEASYDTLALQFGHEVRTRIPMIVYASHVDFEQTNILEFTPPEELLGVTDFLKRRVTLPFRGNWAEFRHTMRHEMVHAFQISLMSESFFQTSVGVRVSLPLWWTEGLAELWSGGEDARDEMILRDLTLEGKLPPITQLQYYAGPLVYPLGGRFHRFLADRYGDWRVAELYKELTRHSGFEEAIRSIYGRSLEQLDAEFQLYMRRRYYPTAETHEPLALLAERVARTAVKPAYLPDTTGDGAGSAVYTSPSSGYLSIEARSLGDPSRTRPLVTGGRSTSLESFHPFDSRVDASRPPYLLLSTRSGGRDALIVWDTNRRKIVGRYQFPELVSILSPAWLPDGHGIVFSGLSVGGISDLYRVTLPEGKLEHLTSDDYQDLDPSPSPDGTRIVFSSDRTAGGDNGAQNLFVLDLRTDSIAQLTAGTWVDEAPVWGRDWRIYYTSSRDTVLNVFSIDTAGQGRRETSAWTGAFDPVPLPSGGLLVGGFDELSWNIYRYRPDSAARAERFATAAPAEPHSRWAWMAPADTGEHATVLGTDRYRRRLTLDIAAGDAAVIPGYGGAQGIAFLLSDLLGDNLLFGSVASFQSRDLGGVLKNLNVTGIYMNRSHRFNWGVGGFRARGYAYEGDNFPQYQETAAGGIGMLSYPINLFDRVTASFTLEHSRRIELTGPLEDTLRVGWIGSNYLTFTRDKTLWIPSGPIDGMRLSVTGGLSNDFSNGRFDSFLLQGDLREYLRLGSEAAIATRAVGFLSGGSRPRRVNLGGTLAMRGYPLYGNILGSRAWMLNNELRFPLLKHLTLGTPFGDVRFPGIQAALFGDVGRVWNPSGSTRALIGSYGVGFRLPILPLTVFRLDVGRRFSDNDYAGYSLSDRQKRRSFVTFFFGYNY